MTTTHGRLVRSMCPPHRWYNRIFFIWVALVATDVSRGQPAKQPPPPPSRTYSVPSAAAPGKSTDVTFYGVDFGDVEGLWTSFPAQTLRVSKAPGGGVIYRLTLPADVPVGLGAVRVATAAGVSSLQPLLIDDLPSGNESGKNVTPGEAQLIVPPLAVDGVCGETASRYFKLAAKKGQRLSAEVVAQRLGSPLDSLLRLLDSSGRELVWCDDSPGVGSDCRFAYTFPADGDYLLELRDVNSDGGPDYRFRLRVGDFPLPVAPFPLGGKRGTKVRCVFDFDATFGTAAIRPVEPAEVLLPADAPRVWAGVKYPDGQGSAFVPLLAGERDAVTETEPNDAPADATPITLPATISGRMDRPGDRDYYRFEARKGDRLAFRARGRSLGLPCEPTLRLFKADGSKLPETTSDAKADPKAAKAEAKIAFPEESALETTIPEDGRYLLRVEDLAGRGGPGAGYRVEAERVRPGFTLGVDVEKVDATAGGTFTLKVTATRREYAGPITLSLGGAAAGWAVEGNVIAEGKSEAQIKVTAPAESAGHGPANLTVIGKATIGGEELVRPASTLTALKKLFPRMPYPPPEWDGLIGVRVKPANPPATRNAAGAPF